MNKIGLLCCFLGNKRPPQYLQLFIDSCRYNSDVDFHFFTEWDSMGDKLPQNVKMHKFSHKDFNQLASVKCGLDINITHGYKLCDLKPAWPHIFEDYIEGYIYVGWFDIDLIFGRITHFFYKFINHNSDFYFTITHDYSSGALTIIKNIPKMRLLYQQAKGWQYIFQDKRHFAFDEYLRIIEPNIESYSDVVFRQTYLKDSIKAISYVAYEKRPHEVIFDSGTVWSEKKEWICFHYVVAKQAILWTLPNWTNIPTKYFINKYGFYVNPKHPQNLLKVLCHFHTLRQVLYSSKKKMNTLKQLIVHFKWQRIINAIKKQL